jgi:hypothetical protein
MKKGSGEGGSCFLYIEWCNSVTSNDSTVTETHNPKLCTRCFKYDRDCLCVNKSQFVTVIFEPPCTLISHSLSSLLAIYVF